MLNGSLLGLLCRSSEGLIVLVSDFRGPLHLEKEHQPAPLGIWPYPIELKASNTARKNQWSDTFETMAEEKEQKGFLKKFGKWAPIIGGAWIVLNIVLPLALLRIPAVQKVLVAVGDKLPFDIPGIG